LAVKSVWQYYVPPSIVLGLLEVFRRMVNESLRIGLGNERSRPPIILEAQGGAVEAVKGNPTPTVIPGVDAPKKTYPTIS